MLRGLVYFGVVFGAGFALGVIRMLVLVPRLGERGAELLEAPVMLAVVVAAASWLIRRLPAPRRLAYLGSGGLALLLLLLAEAALVPALRGQALAAYVAGRDAVSGSLYLLLLALFALMPWALSGGVGARGDARRLEAPPGGEASHRGQSNRV